MRSRFDRQLDALNTDLIEMGTLIEDAIDGASTALTSKNLTLADEVINNDRNVNQKEREIESLCIKLLLQQQPVASDLRLISAALKMVTDMERIGDQASDICEIIKDVGDATYIKQLEHIPMMAAATKRMVTKSIDAYVNSDLDTARAVQTMDDEVDALFVHVRDELILLIAANPQNGRQALDLLMIAKYFERIGDHATNIAEWVEFSITGIHKGEVLG